MNGNFGSNIPSTTGAEFANPSPDQLTPGAKPANDRARTRIYLGLLLLVPLVLVIFNINMLCDSQEVAGWRWFAAGSLVVLLSGFGYLISRALRPFVQSYRLKRGRCIHCGYDFTAHHSIRCPECGKDPVDL